MGVDVDEEVVLVAFGLPRGMREDVARVRLHRDFLQFAELRRNSLKHREAPCYVADLVVDGTFPLAVQHVQSKIRRALARAAPAWREIQGPPLPLIVNADLIVGKNDLTTCDQEK